MEKKIIEILMENLLNKKYLSYFVDNIIEITLNEKYYEEGNIKFQHKDVLNSEYHIYLLSRFANINNDGDCGNVIDVIIYNIDTDLYNGIRYHIKGNLALVAGVIQGKDINNLEIIDDGIMLNNLSFEALLWSLEAEYYLNKRKVSI